MPNLTGRTIKLFLVDGEPDGMLTAEIMNWTGHVLHAPRSRIVELLQRPEAKKTGVYILIGKEADQIMAYVGEGDNVGARLAIHNRDQDKEFWEFVCVITSKDLNLTKAHVRYLESRIIRLINQEGRAKLVNRSEPEFDILPEADISDMDDFITRLQVLLPVLGIQFIRPTPKLTQISQSYLNNGLHSETEGTSSGSTYSRASSSQTRPTTDGDQSPNFRFSSRDINAKAVEVGGQMIVLAGSQARSEEQPSLSSNVRAYREQLKRSGKLVPSAADGLSQFTEDVAFTSPSAAAQAVAGTSRNGRVDWIVENTGQTYANWQESEIAKAQKMATL
jgi:hypothetical protein